MKNFTGRAFKFLSVLSLVAVLGMSGDAKGVLHTLYGFKDLGPLTGAQITTPTSSEYLTVWGEPPEVIEPEDYPEPLDFRGYNISLGFVGGGYVVGWANNEFVSYEGYTGLVYGIYESGAPTIDALYAWMDTNENGIMGTYDDQTGFVTIDDGDALLTQDHIVGGPISLDGNVINQFDLRPPIPNPVPSLSPFAIAFLCSLLGIAGIRRLQS